MPINHLPTSENYEHKKELLRAYYADYERLLQEAPELVGKLRFDSFIKFSFDLDRQQQLIARRQERNL
ncbi:hypothetical protein [Hymenobacter daeguensis]